MRVKCRIKDKSYEFHREICRKYKIEKNPNFTLDEIHECLRGFGQEYLDLNVRRDLLRGFPYIEIDDNLNLLLNIDGRKFCDNESSKL
ncbi:MAG TPA: hypothetical protein VHJ38_02115 [Nitrososphaeraceae archaeon]|jgi:hypothetical protein|nr:hypothetical protein [Nitrososphaeraceae archaeon]